MYMTFFRAERPIILWQTGMRQLGIAHGLNKQYDFAIIYSHAMSHMHLTASNTMHPNKIQGKASVYAGYFSGYCYKVMKK